MVIRPLWAERPVMLPDNQNVRPGERHTLPSDRARIRLKAGLLKQRAKGRHRRPSAVQKAAQRAGMAAPVIAVSGAMAAAPAFMTASQVHQTLAETSSHTVTARLDAMVRPAAPAARTYTTQAGDTLYGIALRFYGHGSYWRELYWANRSTISNPNLIHAGQVLTIPWSHEVVMASAPSAPDPSSVAATTSRGGTSTQSSSGGSSAVRSDIATGNNLLAIGQYLVDNGYSKAAAAGVASCVDGESMGNPESVGTGGGGLIGWTPLGSAMPDPNIITGDVSQDMMTQLTDLLFYNSNEIGQPLVDELNSQTDPVAAADFYSQNFEKPAVTDSDVVPSVAEQIYSELGG
jgi:LysM repeat protein